MTKKTVEQALKDGDFVEISGYDTRKAGIQVKVIIPKADCDLIENKPGRKMKSLLNATAWTILKCQRTGVKQNAIVALDAAGFPKMAMACCPFSDKDMSPVIIVSRRASPRQEEKPVCPKTKSKAE